MITSGEEEAINVVVRECFVNSVEHGFWDDFYWDSASAGVGINDVPNNPFAIAVKLSLIHSEVSEALEGDRNGISFSEKGGLAEELADVVIRAFDLAGAYNIRLGTVLAHKMEVNAARPRKHGKKY